MKSPTFQSYRSDTVRHVTGHLAGDPKAGAGKGGPVFELPPRESFRSIVRGLPRYGTCPFPARGPTGDRDRLQNRLPKAILAMGGESHPGGRGGVLPPPVLTEKPDATGKKTKASGPGDAAA